MESQLRGGGQGSRPSRSSSYIVCMCVLVMSLHLPSYIRNPTIKKKKKHKSEAREQEKTHSLGVNSYT